MPYTCMSPITVYLFKHSFWWCFRVSMGNQVMMVQKVIRWDIQWQVTQKLLKSRSVKLFSFTQSSYWAMAIYEGTICCCFCLAWKALEIKGKDLWKSKKDSPYRSLMRHLNSKVGFMDRTIRLYELWRLRKFFQLLSQYWLLEKSDKAHHAMERFKYLSTLENIWKNKWKYFQAVFMITYFRNLLL